MNRLGVAIVLALFVNGKANAAYEFSTNLTITSTTNGASGINTSSSTLGGVTIAFTPEGPDGGLVPSMQTFRIGNFTVAVLPGTAPTSFDVTVRDTISIIDGGAPGTVGSGDLVVNDTFRLMNIS